MHQAIHGEELGVLSPEANTLAGFKRCQAKQELLRGFQRNRLQMIAPESAIHLKRHQQCALNPNKPSGNNGPKFKKTLEVGEAALSEREGHQQILIAALFTAQAVEQLTQ